MRQESENSLGKLILLVVTYNQSFADSECAESLGSLDSLLKKRIKIVCVINSDEGREITPSTAAGFYGYEEFFAKSNGGLSGGYNKALALSQRTAKDTLLFLNADAVVSSNFISTLLKNVDEQPFEQSWSPILISHKKRVSPFRKRGFNYPFWIISYLAIRSSALKENFRFPDRFWLDGIDYWLSHKMHFWGIKVHQLSVTVPHNLSVINEFKTISIFRYQNIIDSEYAFNRDFGNNRLNFIYLLLRAFIRCVIHKRFDLLMVVIKSFHRV